MSAVDDALGQISQTPFIYPVLYKRVRRALLFRFPYSIFFVMNPKVVTVVAVLHQARDPRRWPRSM